MLLAELHGKRVPEAFASEDYLTSAIFGALQFLEVKTFWTALFERVFSAHDPSITLLTRFQRDNVQISEYQITEANFWQYLPNVGEPDLTLHFQSPNRTAVRLMIEVKLHSGKSSCADDDDQLGRYLNHVLVDVADSNQALIFLTDGEKPDDLAQTLAWTGLSDANRARQLLFSLTWQDVQQVASDFVAQCPSDAEDRLMQIQRAMLGQVAEYLAIELAHFDGMNQFHAVVPLQIQHLIPLPCFSQIPNLGTYLPCCLDFLYG